MNSVAPAPPQGSMTTLAILNEKEVPVRNPFWCCGFRTAAITVAIVDIVVRNMSISSLRLLDDL